jgi:hypothetical protein
VDAGASNTRRWMTGAGLVAAGVIAGAVLAGTVRAGAATLTGNSNPSNGGTVAGQYGGPGVQENDGIPESQEHHGGALSLTGTVTAVGSDSVTIKTSTGATTTDKVDTNSDIDKSGEAKLSDLKSGDAVRYSVRSGTTTIDKLHAGDESKNFPSGGPGRGHGDRSGGSGTTNSSGSSA